MKLNIRFGKVVHNIKERFNPNSKSKVQKDLPKGIEVITVNIKADGKLKGVELKDLYRLEEISTSSPEAPDHTSIRAVASDSQVTVTDIEALKSESNSSMPSQQIRKHALSHTAEQLHDAAENESDDSSSPGGNSLKSTVSDNSLEIAQDARAASDHLPAIPKLAIPATEESNKTSANLTKLSDSGAKSTASKALPTGEAVFAAVLGDLLDEVIKQTESEEVIKLPKEVHVKEAASLKTSSHSSKSLVAKKPSTPILLEDEEETRLENYCAGEGKGFKVTAKKSLSTPALETFNSSKGHSLSSSRILRKKAGSEIKLNEDDNSSLSNFARKPGVVIQITNTPQGEDELSVASITSVKTGSTVVTIVQTPIINGGGNATTVVSAPELHQSEQIIQALHFATAPQLPHYEQSLNTAHNKEGKGKSKITPKEKANKHSEKETPEGSFKFQDDDVYAHEDVYDSKGCSCGFELGIKEAVSAIGSLFGL
jgi:hypothetical protein